ncbi:MAG: hypothetical protein KC421_13925 [Anaerolineales bacterium]|nr:hypothetical protein [Anaerolineales bacterium]
MLRFIHAWLVYTWGGLHRYFGNKNNMVSEHERAIHYFAKAYQIDPTFRAARLQRAVLLYRELRRHQEAVAEFDALLDGDRTYAAALLNRGLALQEIGHYPEALADIEQYLKLPEKDDYREEVVRIAAFLREIVSES